MTNQNTIRMRVIRSRNQYLGECLDYPVMTHGRSLEELATNMEKALGLFLSRLSALGEQEEGVIVDLELDFGEPAE